MTTYVLVALAADYDGPKAVTGFKSKRAAWEAAPICTACLEDVARGYHQGEDGKRSYTVSSIGGSACGLEFMVLTQAEHASKDIRTWEERDKARAQRYAKLKRSRKPRR